MRISRPRMFMEIAHVVAKRSTCFRLNVGAIIVIKNRIVSMGYNGQAPGAPHCERMCDPGQCSTIHAEINALRNLKHYAERLTDVQMYCTESPCIDCANEMIGTIGQLFFTRAYRDTSPLDFLTEKMDVYQILPSGVVIDFVSKKVVL